MRIVIAGGTGFLGAPLAESYGEEGHDVRVLTRAVPDGESRHEPGTGVPGVTRVGWRPDGNAGRWAADVDGADAVINLAGESIGDGRWTPQRKAALVDSRIVPTRSLVAAIRSSAAPPGVFVSGSAVGYYGPSADELKTESDPPGKDFLATICEDWEAEARRAEGAATRVVCIRTGVALERSGGALRKMLLPFRMFAGGPMGSGRQYMSWIHRIDWIEMVRWIVETPQVTGAVNATAPEPVTNREFARALGRALHRPAFMPAPGFALRLALGEMAGPLILEGQRVVPAKALSLGFHFRYPEIDQAMRGIFET
ncbi:MAG: TIGR01777 family protein [Acidobacteria bacterium RIFCSPLOWO2_02_FULL_67_36]|nr:MAG: TIGR01777 family protein [Acidobacteria bacterium RIFCSPLOWO2_02_FULL_67_36]OFW24415.1 MAG: TIGR01777 family protein [Acidobacteria bacterium RIFCSPLOWO2_12_FULL_66_21]